MLALWLTTGLLAASEPAPVAKAEKQWPGSRVRRYAPRVVQRAYRRTEEILAEAGVIEKVVEAVKAAAPVFAGTEVRTEYDALRLKAERMAREEAASEQWRADLGRAAIIAELRLLMASIEAAAIDDEEAAELLLLAA